MRLFHLGLQLLLKPFLLHFLLSEVLFLAYFGCHLLFVPLISKEVKLFLCLELLLFLAFFYLDALFDTLLEHAHIALILLGLPQLEL